MTVGADDDAAPAAHSAPRAHLQASVAATVQATPRHSDPPLHSSGAHPLDSVVVPPLSGDVPSEGAGVLPSLADVEQHEAWMRHVLSESSGSTRLPSAAQQAALPTGEGGRGLSDWQGMSEERKQQLLLGLTSMQALGVGSLEDLEAIQVCGPEPYFTPQKCAVHLASGVSD